MKTKTEQEKYFEAMHKMHELKNVFDDMLPDTKARFIKDLAQLTGIQQLLNELQKYYVK